MHQTTPRAARSSSATFLFLDDIQGKKRTDKRPDASSGITISDHAPVACMLPGRERPHLR